MTRWLGVQPFLVVLLAVAASAADPVTPQADATQINWWLMAGLVGNVLLTNGAMVALKSQFPGWQNKAWAPVLIGIAGGVLGALASGQVTSWPSLLAWVATGAGAGGFASSLRDTAKDAGMTGTKAKDLVVKKKKGRAA
jgi:hypothetical protein